MRLTPVVKNLLILNVAFFLIVQLDKMYGMSTFGGQEGYFGLENLLALHYPTSEYFKPVQIVTHFFMHGGMMHIFFNMFALAMFGPPLETMWGSKRFVNYYILCAFGSAALHMGYMWWDISQMQNAISAYTSNPTLAGFNDFFDGIALEAYRMEDGRNVGVYAQQIREAIADGNVATAVNEGGSLMKEWVDTIKNIPMVGASGAIYGLLLAFGMYFPDFKLMLIFLPIPIKARYFIPILIVVEIFLGLQQYSWDNIAHFAHLGGALIGFLLILYWRKFDPPTGTRWN